MTKEKFEIQRFNHTNFGEIRTITDESGKVWFVANEIAKELNYKQPKDAIRNHCKYAKLLRGDKSSPLTTNKFGIKIIPETDLYRLIMRSKLPKAENFQDWVVEEILPTIRKTGGYVHKEDGFIETYMPFADENIKKLFKQTLGVIRKQNEVLSEMKPKAEYFDDLVDRNLLTNFRDTAKELKIGQKKFIVWLETKKYIYKNRKKQLRPYSNFVPDLFQLKEFSSSKYSGVQTLITPKGRETFKLFLMSKKNILT